MPSLDQILSRVVERKGYAVLGADKEALLAKKGDEALLAAWKIDGPVTAADAQLFLTAFQQVHANTGLLVAPKGADEAAKAVLAAAKIDLWAESRLVIEVGDAYVKDAIEVASGAAPATGFPPTPTAAPAPAAGPRKFPSLVAQAASAASSASSSGAAYFMPNKKKEAPVDMQAQIPQGRGGQLGYAWGGASGGGSSNAGIAQIRNGRNPRLKTDQWGNLIDPNKAQPAAAAAAMPAAVNEDVEIIATPKRRAAPAPAPAPAAPASPYVDADKDAYEIISSKPKKEAAAPAAVKDATPPACNTLKLNVTKDDAVAKTGKPGNAKLALVPHIAFEYDLSMSRPGMPAPVTGSGAVLINSLSGDLRPLDTHLAYNASEPADARKDQEKLTAVDVYDKIKSHMAKTFSRTINVEREVAGNTVMETMKLTPDPEEMGLEHKGIVYLPVWEVTTSTGVTKVDAFTGAVLS